MNSSEPVDEFERSRRVREHINELTAPLAARIFGGQVDANGRVIERRANPDRARFHAVVASGDSRQIGAMTDDLLDEIATLKAQIINTTKESN